MAVMCDAVNAADRSRSTVRSTCCDPGCSAVRLPTEMRAAPTSAARSSDRVEYVFTPLCAMTITASSAVTCAHSGYVAKSNDETARASSPAERSSHAPTSAA